MTSEENAICGRHKVEVHDSSVIFLLSKRHRVVDQILILRQLHFNSSAALALHEIYQQTATHLPSSYAFYHRLHWPRKAVCAIAF